MKKPPVVRALLLLAALSIGCLFGSGPYRTLLHEQRLPSGRVVQVVSCQLAWGVEHDERHLNQDGFALEYLSGVSRDRPEDVEKEALEAFELIRPISEEWGLSSATVTALRTPERTGTYYVFAFTRPPGGAWSHVRQSITRNAD